MLRRGLYPPPGGSLESYPGQKNRLNQADPGRPAGGARIDLSNQAWRGWAAAGDSGE
jgi:hypothetical protein